MIETPGNNFDSVTKMVKVNPASEFALGHAHTTTWYKFWQHFKAFVIPIILYQFQKDPFCLIILYDILFYFMHIYIAPGQEETTLGDIFFLMEAEKSYHFDHWSGRMFKKITMPSDFMHTFS